MDGSNRTFKPNPERGPPERVAVTREVNVQLSATVYERLKAATDRPGVGKSMVVEAALERFLDPAPPIEGVLYQHLDRMNHALERLARDVQIIAETVALHARYHLTVNPPLSRSEQREACALGDARFKVLAEQVERRVRLNRPLMRGTMETLRTTTQDGAASEINAEVDAEHLAVNNVLNTRPNVSAAVREGGSQSNFRHLPNAFC